MYKTYVVNNNLLKLSNNGVFDTEIEVLLNHPVGIYQGNKTYSKIRKIIYKTAEKISKTKLFFKLNNYSTGRLSKWLFILVYNDRIILGHGPNMDRNFYSDQIQKTKMKYVGPPDQSFTKPGQTIQGANDSASGIFYQYIAGGMVGMIGLILFFIIIAIKIIDNTKLQNKFFTSEKFIHPCLYFYRSE